MYAQTRALCRLGHYADLGPLAMQQHLASLPCWCELKDSSLDLPRGGWNVSMREKNNTKISHSTNFCLNANVDDFCNVPKDFLKVVDKLIW